VLLNRRENLLEKGLIKKNSLFGKVALYQNQAPSFCAAKIILFLWSSFLYERKVVGKI
jgi:hypothetical protein